MKKNFWKSASKYFRAFLITALAFLVIGLGTLGSVMSTGDSFVLTSKQSGDEKEPSLMFHVMLPEGLDEDTDEYNLYVKKVLVNVGAVYAPAGEDTDIRIGRGTSPDLIYSLTYPLTVPSVYRAENGSDEALANGPYNWAVFDVTSVTEKGWRLRDYAYYCFFARSNSVRINEVVFVAENNDLPEEERKPVVLAAELDDASIIRRAEGETKEEALERASAVLDSQYLPTLSSSSFYCYSEEEAYSMMTIAEMRAGGSYVKGDTYLADTVYNALGTDILALGTLIFGMSPFGLRIFPFLAAFGVLVLGYFLVRDLSKSERAGFIFAVLYALSAAFFAAGHLGTPLMLGVFFFTASVYFCHKFYAKGMKTADFKGALPVILSALFGALAVCTNGVWVIPMLGVIALFVVGMVRQRKAKAYYLAKAEAMPEAPAAAEETPVPSPKEHVEREYRRKDRAAIASFAVVFLIGSLVLSLLAVIPAYLPYVRVFGDPAAPMGVFAVAWKLFAGGFTGVNVTSYAQSWSLHTIFAGTGELFAVTCAGLLTAAVAAAASIAALVWFLVGKKQCEKPALRALVIAAVGLVLALVSSFFGGGSFGFTLTALIFLFAIGGFAGDQVLAEGGRAAKVAMWVIAVLLILSFVLLIPFTFSVPLPAGLQTALFA
ncbi:MAG TPA: glycosyltransferase family 39 protein [Candidatus Gallimonas intestinavium]|uniref:Glycosyltransferase family 39 protein n=1 Tax=Candidatus Gallimonas intestinavium TaxID=2838603 RepID=A0A9D2G568_9FIRM|nr:glycosyltransferase family 39 protein [Candidatus Gallimonas intestinavium]